MPAESTTHSDGLYGLDLAEVLLCLPLVVAALYAVVAIGAHWISLRMIFPRPPVTYDPGPDHVALKARNGVTIVGRHWRHPDAKHTILWFHGNGEDLGTIAGVVDGWKERAYNVFAIDYRGYGHSGGSPTEENTYADAALALDWLRNEKRVPLERIVILGYSVGSGPAVELARRERVAGLILLSPFVSAYRVMTRWPLLLGDKFRNLQKIARVKCPLLVIHGTADAMIPVWHGRALFGAASSRKSNLWIQGAGHGDLEEVAGESYWRTIREFTESL